MFNSLRLRLILSYLGIALLTATLIYLLIRLTSDQRFKTLILEQQLSEIEEQVLHWYEVERHWDGFESYFLSIYPPPTGRNGSPRADHGVVTADKQVIIRFRDYRSGDIVPNALLAEAVPVTLEQETIAWIIPADQAGLSLAGEETVYLQRTNQVLLIAGLIGVVVALVMGLGLARFLLRPIDALTQASQRMAQGDLEQRVPIYQHDELGQLAASFNSMSHEVALAHQRRKQLTADIAHDLSTPLQNISGYVEAIQHGELAPTAERMGIIATELDHLRRLIEDLDLLAQADTETLTLHIEPLNLTTYLPQITASFQPLADEQKIDMTLRPITDELSAIHADPERLTQVLGNILTNALRHTPTNGKIEIDVIPAQNQAQITIQDSGNGITADRLPFIFDRFYQTDQQRSRSGKMGLGLAISKGLIEAMGGEITAASDGRDQGSTITITLPYFPH